VHTPQILSGILLSPSGFSPCAPCVPGDAIETNSGCQCWDECRLHHQRSVT